MRMMMTVSIPVETGNAAIRKGTLQTTMQKILKELKPEAAYFTTDNAGNRSGFLFFEMKDSSQMPAAAEPWFLAFNAQISFRPVMNAKDLAAADKALKEAG